MPDAPSQKKPQVVAPSWRETDRFVPRRVVRPIQSLMAAETSSAAVVLLATIAALVVANTPLVDAYHHFWEAHLVLEAGGTTVIELTAHELVNDALMALFFLLVSLEIKREIVFGELHDPRAAAMPIIAAAGGMVVPALIYLAFNAGGDYVSGL